MPQNKRLHFKDFHALRALVFFPVYLFCILSLINPEKSGILFDFTKGLGKIAQSSFDFFFFLSAFLITSHGLREYKYLKSFSLKNFLLRRSLRIGAVLIIALTFAFFLHPWLVKVLDLHPITLPDKNYYLSFLPNYLSDFDSGSMIYLQIISTIFMFIQFYLVWGIVLKFLHRHLVIVSIIVIVAGIISRIIHLDNTSIFILDTLAYGIPIGAGALIAIAVRKDAEFLETLKNFSKKRNIIIYFIGTAVFLGGYILTAGWYASVFVPIITALFFCYLIIDQTFGKNSFIQLKNRKVLTYLGKISYGLTIYQALIGVLFMIAVESLDFNLLSGTTVVLIIIAAFIGTVIVADISYKILEKPLIRLRREFKKV